MRCPTCSQDLVPIQYKGVAIERCGRCHASWFGPGALVACAQELAREGVVPDAQWQVNKKVLAVGRLQEPALPCPRCGRPMHKLNYGYDSNVILDHCRDCDGLWVGDDELGGVAVHVKGNPRVDALGSAFMAEGVAVDEERRKAEYLVSLFNPFSWSLSIPYRTDIRVVSPPILVTAIIAANLAAYFCGLSGWLESTRSLRCYGLVPALAAAGHNYHAFLTSMFLHAGILHLLGNMYFLWLFGRNAESSLGRRDFFLLYFVCGMTAGVVQVLFDPGSANPSIGASGAISGVLGCFARLYPDSRVKLWEGRDQRGTFSARFYLGAWFLFQAASFLKDVALDLSPGVAFSSHIGGFLAGYVLAPVKEEARTDLQGVGI
ncbi:MAG: rhomboid family intramembrane serine protease [Elusimicrobia bacterium]|nr:rhomboid family intramembrane serine protease [Elusimicrobiota bacterium]